MKKYKINYNIIKYFIYLYSTKTFYIMTAEFTKFDNSSNWVYGICGDYQFQAKLYDIPSMFGIKDGRVSKLWIADTDKKCLVNFDRGWDKKPSAEIKPYFDAIMLLLEQSPKRFE